MVSRREFYVTLVLVAVLGACVGVLGRQYTGSDPAFPGLRAAEAKMLASRPFSFAGVARDAMPAVVNVFTRQRVRIQPFPAPFGGDPLFDRFFRDFFPDGPIEREQRSLGSGVLIDADGFIITNHHVVANADEIRVKLSDTREFPATLLGSDPRTDLALIRIEGEDLPNAKLGDSDELGVGDWVLAIGNPFGLEQTVTAGIVSAKERVIGAGPFDDFIQTDASINPGNSGGPLIDIDGRVVGVNTAIFSRTGGSVGIGFAIPINMVKQVSASLREHRRVVRGWLGVATQDVTPELARVFDLDTTEGAVVSDIYRGGPAHEAGIRRGDVIVSYAGKPVESSRDVSRRVADSQVGDRIAVEVIREGKRRKFEARITEPPGGK